MGTVAFIEEKGELNLGLGIPAGATTILAAGKQNNECNLFQFALNVLFVCNNNCCSITFF